MKLLSLIPLIAVMLIDAVVIGYVMRSALRTKSGFFLIINALALMFLAGMGAIVGAFQLVTPATLSLPFFASLIVPANFLYFAMTSPEPIRESWHGMVPLVLIFLPAIALTSYQLYLGETAIPFRYSYVISMASLSLDGALTRASLLYCSVWIVIAICLFGVRYVTSEGTEHVVAKHMIVVMAGPLFFGSVYWVASNEGSYIPSPTLMFAIMAQVGLIAVLRQEEINNPRLFSRVVYYTTAVLVALLLGIAMTEFYTLQVGRFVFDTTMLWIVIVASFLLILVTRFSRVERTLDKLLFQRAAEYRRVVEETQLELKQARERLRQAERLSVVGELSARVAHEIKNPLGPIRGYTQMMREKLEDEREFKHREAFLRHLSIIQEEAENIDRRVKTFLETSRQPELLIEDVSINKIAERCARLIKLEVAAGVESMANKKVNVSVYTDRSLGTLEADHGRLEEAFYNITRNAFDAVANKDYGNVSIYTNARDINSRFGVEFRVTDNGKGFASEETSDYFKSFYTEKKQGTGLGLAIVKSCIEAHSGIIEVGNLPEGGGDVRIWLPLKSNPNPGALLPKGGEHMDDGDQTHEAD